LSCFCESKASRKRPFTTSLLQCSIRMPSRTRLEPNEILFYTQAILGLNSWDSPYLWKIANGWKIAMTWSWYYLVKRIQDSCSRICSHARSFSLNPRWILRFYWSAVEISNWSESKTNNLLCILPRCDDHISPWIVASWAQNSARWILWFKTPRRI
jgi:hypothetical protein